MSLTAVIRTNNQTTRHEQSPRRSDAARARRGIIVRIGVFLFFLLCFYGVGEEREKSFCFVSFFFGRSIHSIYSLFLFRFGLKQKSIAGCNPNKVAFRRGTGRTDGFFFLSLAQQKEEGAKGAKGRGPWRGGRAKVGMGKTWGKKMRWRGDANSPGVGTSFAILRTILPILEADNVSPVNGRRSVIYSNQKPVVREQKTEQENIFQFRFEEFLESRHQTQQHSPFRYEIVIRERFMGVRASADKAEEGRRRTGDGCWESFGARVARHGEEDGMRGLRATKVKQTMKGKRREFGEYTVWRTNRKNTNHSRVTAA